MIKRRGFGRVSFLAGSSVHQRLWRDVYAAVSCFFHQLFNHLESLGHLDYLSDIDLFCLHCVYVPRINRSLDDFVRGWNQHTISGQGKSPVQMFGVNRPLHHDNIFHTLLGIDNEGPEPDRDCEETTVSIPEIQVPLSDDQFEQLKVSVNPFSSTMELICF